MSLNEELVNLEDAISALSQNIGELTITLGAILIEQPTEENNRVAEPAGYGNVSSVSISVISATRMINEYASYIGNLRLRVDL